MQNKVRWEEMFRDELADAIARRPVCYLAYGLAEPHGVQNALGLDGLKAQGIVEAAAAAHGGVVAPMTWWHVHETPLGTAWLATVNAPQPYLTDVPPEVFLQQIVYQLRAVELAGFRAAILLSGHYGGIEVDMKMVARIYSAHRPLRTAAMADYEIMKFKDYNGDHAGRCETSQLWALRPELTDLSRMPDKPVEGVHFASGDWARAANRRDGEGILASQIEALRKLSDVLLGDAASQTFADTTERPPYSDFEPIWQDVLSHRADWISSHSPEGFWEYLEQRRKLFPLPAID